MNALTLPNLLQPLEQNSPDSFSVQTTRPKFTRSKRTSDLRVAFKANAYEGCAALVEQVRATRGSLGCDSLGGFPVAEAVVLIGETRCRVYLAGDGSLVAPAVVVAPAALQRLRDEIVAALADLAQAESAAR